MRNHGRLFFSWALMWLLRLLRSFVMPLLCGLLLLFSADCGLSESDLRYSHPDTPIVAICDKPLDVPKDVEFWGYDFTTRRDDGARILGSVQPTRV